MAADRWSRALIASEARSVFLATSGRYPRSRDSDWERPWLMQWRRRRAAIIAKWQFAKRDLIIKPASERHLKV